MTKTKSTKRALLLCGLSLLLCMSMFIGSTFAWFTDEVTSAGNVIQSGTLDVALEWADGTTDPTDTTWTDASTTAIFNYDLWEPGYTEVRHIRISNNGTLALKYQVYIIANGEVSELSNVIDVYYVDPAVQVDERTDLTDGMKLGTLTDVLANLNTTGSGHLLAGESVTITLALKMQEDAGNEYQDLSIGSDFTVKLLATQYTYENDSFDDQYDANAEYYDPNAVYPIRTIPELREAAAEGGKYILMNDLTMTDEDDTSTIQILKDFELNLNGFDLDLRKVSGAAFEMEEGVKATINPAKDQTADNESIFNTGAAFVSYGDTTLNNLSIQAGDANNYAGITRGGTTTYNNVTLTSGGGGIGAADGAQVVFNSGKVYVDSASTSGRYIFYTEGEGSTITINDGDFSWDKNDNNKRAYIYANAGTTVYVNGGTFGKASTRDNYNAGIMGDGTVIITGGTFGFDPSKWVADGYVAVKSGTTWTVNVAQ